LEEFVNCHQDVSIDALKGTEALRIEAFEELLQLNNSTISKNDISCIKEEKSNDISCIKNEKSE